ncbi:MAG: hypothetical protein PHW82_17540 [Bacteroidales bacterium]|nr:hypothetical protein [Bacteroidales bacterium]
MFSISTHYLIKEAEKRGLKLEVINEDFNLFYLSNNEKKILFKNID